MEKLEGVDRLVDRHEVGLSVPGHACEAVFWHNPNFEKLGIRGRVVYVPGIPGNTLDEFGEEASHWTLGDKKWVVWGVPHSGLCGNRGIAKKSGVVPEDWVWDAKIVIKGQYSKEMPLVVIGHSFGGLFALAALADLAREEEIDRYHSQIQLITVSSPTYFKSSLPDTHPLLGTNSNAKFSFYPEPMASISAFEHIWDYLQAINLGGALADRDKFNTNLMQLIEGLEKRVAVLGNSEIKVITLFPKQDRWVGEKAGQDLQQMMQRKILIESFDIPSSGYQSTVDVNAHDLVKEWSGAVCKYL